MIDGAPEIVGLSIDLHEDLIQVPLPLCDLTHERRALHANLAGKYRVEPIDLEPDTFVADINSALMEKIFDSEARAETRHIASSQAG